MGDPTNLPAALVLIKDIDDDRQMLVDQLKNALAPDGPHRQKARNRVTLAHGEVRDIGREMEAELQWVLVNVSMGEIIPRVGAITAVLSRWKNSSYTKFDDTAIPL